MLPHIIQIMDDHDLILKPMVTWGSPILGPPSYSPLCAQTEAEPVELPKEEDNFSFFLGGTWVSREQWCCPNSEIYASNRYFTRKWCFLDLTIKNGEQWWFKHQTCVSGYILNITVLMVRNMGYNGIHKHHDIM